MKYLDIQIRFVLVACLVEAVWPNASHVDIRDVEDSIEILDERCQIGEKWCVRGWPACVCARAHACAWVGVAYAQGTKGEIVIEGSNALAKRVSTCESSGDTIISACVTFFFSPLLS